MKNFRILMLTAVVSITGATLFNACGDDDQQLNSPPIDNTDFAATYKLTSYLPFRLVSAGVYEADGVDLNADGVESFDMVQESTCFGQSYIKFNADHTYRLVYTYTSGGSADAPCESQSDEVGVWKREGDIITTTSSGTNGIEYGMEEGDREYTYNESTGTLSISRVPFAYPSGSSNGRVDFTFTREVQ